MLKVGIYVELCMVMQMVVMTVNGCDKMLLKKFRGCMMGALLGDCFGAPYEHKKITNPLPELQSYFDKLEESSDKTLLYKYTDDTAMTIGVAESLILQNSFDARHMAERFVNEYYNEPNRGYASNVRKVFVKLKNRNFEDVWAPASEQFHGFGSYGNGGAMRISPVPLFAYNNFSNMVEIAEQSTKLTHTHPHGVIGATLQLNRDPKIPLDVADYTSELATKIIEVENRVSRVVKDDNSYRDRMRKLQLLLEMKDKVSSDLVVEELGNDFTAISSVPTAIYCFLRALQPFPGIETDNPFRRTIQYAISLGGDTDTIASMAGAIAGGYYGIDMINENLQRLAEGSDMVNSLATTLYERVAS